MDLIKREDARNAVVQSGGAMDAVAAINALPAVQVGVKPLEWEERGTDFWRALGTDRVYEVIALADGRFFLTNGPRLSDYPTLEAAKAAAQADYDARIRSALTVQPAPEVAALVEAAKEASTDLLITAYNARHAAKTDHLWEGVAENLDDSRASLSAAVMRATVEMYRMVEALRDIAEPTRLFSHGDPGVLRAHARAALDSLTLTA